MPGTLGQICDRVEIDDSDCCRTKWEQWELASVSRSGREHLASRQCYLFQWINDMVNPSARGVPCPCFQKLRFFGESLCVSLGARDALAISRRCPPLCTRRVHLWSWALSPRVIHPNNANVRICSLELNQFKVNYAGFERQTPSEPHAYSSPNVPDTHSGIGAVSYQCDLVLRFNAT